MDEIDAKLAAAADELKRLGDEIETLGDRFTGGERTVRPELNAAIRRQHELSKMHHELLVSSGRYVPEPPVMYGPPAVKRAESQPKRDESQPKRSWSSRLFGK